MENSEGVKNEIITPMMACFSPPLRMDEGQQTTTLRHYVEALQSFASVDLQSAWNSVRDSHTQRSWPAVAVFVLAARQARKDRVPNERATTRSDSPTPAALWARWEKIRGGDLAVEASERGVAWAFKCAVLGGQNPEQIDMHDLEMKKLSAEHTMEKIDRGEPVEHIGRVLKFSEDNAAFAARTWRQVQIRNAETDTEIRRARGLAA